MSDKEEIKTFLDSISNSPNIGIKTYIAENSSSNIFFNMVYNLWDYDEKEPEFMKCVIKRLYLEKEKGSKELEEYYSYLANSDSILIRKFVAKTADKEILLDMIKYNQAITVIYILLERLNSIKDTITANDYLKMSSTPLEEIQNFIANNALTYTIFTIAQRIYQRIIIWNTKPTLIIFNRLKKEIQD